MSTPLLFLDTNLIRSAIMNPTGGVVGVVADVLRLCQEQGLQLDWRDSRCCVHSIKGDKEAIVDVPLRKSIFRAILARIATLCDEQAPGSFSPYGGQGKLSLGSNPRTALAIAWVNTLDEQRLAIKPISTEDETTGLHVARESEKPSAEMIALRALQK